MRSGLLAASGSPRLAKSQNQYDDLQTVFGLQEGFVHTRREVSILYDRSGKAEYFQIYSVPTLDGLFF